METIRLATFAIRCYAVNLPLYTLNTMYINYVQGCAKIQLANFLSLCNRLLYIVPCAFLFGKIWGVLRYAFIAVQGAFPDGQGGGITQGYSKERFDSFIRFAMPLYAATVITIANASLQPIQSSEVCL